MAARRTRLLARSRCALVVIGAGICALTTLSAPGATAHADADRPMAGRAPNVPYQLPVTLPPRRMSPPSSADAPYTPAVLSLIAQLEPSNPPTKAQLDNADQLLVGTGIELLYGIGKSPVLSCNNSGSDVAPIGTTPVISPLCWSEGQGLEITIGEQRGQSTASMQTLGLGASFDRAYANAWGQSQGGEARSTMVTGIHAPQVDTDLYVNWIRSYQTPGEDPLVNGILGSEQVNGIQSQGTMTQVKHFLGYNGSDIDKVAHIQDQALHEIQATPYEMATVAGNSASVMCSYQLWQDDSVGVPTKGRPALTQKSPYGNEKTATWPMNEPHYGCEHPLSMNAMLRGMWGSQAFVASDYGGLHSASAVLQGLDEEQPSAALFGTGDVVPGDFFNAKDAVDSTGNTCADSNRNPVPCTAPGATHVAGIPSPSCGEHGCQVGQAALVSALPMSIFNQALARTLYAEERFGLLGCNDSVADCANRGGVGGDRSGNAAIPTGPSSGPVVPGTKNGDAAIVEKGAEEGAVLLENSNGSLPIDGQALRGGVAVSGGGAEYLIASPSNEGSRGYPDRIAINPLQQLQDFSGRPTAFSYSPAGGATGYPVPGAALSTTNTSVTGGLTRSSGPGAGHTDTSIDFTSASGAGQLTPGNYTWNGYLYVPTTDHYTFRLQQSSSIPADGVHLSIDDADAPLAAAAPFYYGHYYGGAPVPVGTTRAGYTEPGMTNRQFDAGTLTGGSYHRVRLTFANATTGKASFRFGYDRASGDATDAAAAAKGKSMAVVFANDNSTKVLADPGTPDVTIGALPDDQVALIRAVAAANPHTVVVLNTNLPVITRPWIDDPGVSAVLEMWNPGQEGGTATARLLLGLANPSGHTPLTWPANATDTVYGYDQQGPLYPGDTSGIHRERMGGAPDLTTDETEGIYSGYRYYDKLGIPVQFPFGYGLSYTSFAYSDLDVGRADDGGLDVSFTVKNTGDAAGTAVPQVYLGAPDQAPTGIQFAARSLVQFDRIELRPRAAKKLTEHVPLRQLQYWSPRNQRWVVAGGRRTVYVGGADSVASLALHANVTLPVAGDLQCADSQLNSTVIHGSLTVPPGTWCDLVNVVVDGDLTIDRAAGMRVTGSTINGDVNAVRMRGAADPLSAAANVLCGSTVHGSVTISRGSSSAPWSIGSCGANTIDGSVTFDHNQSRTDAITGNTIRGSLTTRDSNSVVATGNTVQGRGGGS